MRKLETAVVPDPKPKETLPSPVAVRDKVRRMSPELRRKILLERATVFFADHGMSAPTRALADACGVAQRLLYRYFPSKAALLEEIYEHAILAPFKAVWLIRLADREQDIETRIRAFYTDYYQTVLSRQWIRLFLYGGLDGGSMTPAYIDGVIKQFLEVLVREAADARKVELPSTVSLLHEIGWTLHGTVSHLAIRQHIYGASQMVPLADIIAMQVAAFLDGLPAAAAVTRAQEALMDRKIPLTVKSSVAD
jgi:AcrR family transcriptional regulator